MATVTTAKAIRHPRIFTRQLGQLGNLILISAAHFRQSMKSHKPLSEQRKQTKPNHHGYHTERRRHAQSHKQEHTAVETNAGHAALIFMNREDTFCANSKRQQMFEVGGGEMHSDSSNIISRRGRVLSPPHPGELLSARVTETPDTLLTPLHCFTQRNEAVNQIKMIKQMHGTVWGMTKKALCQRGRETH